MGGSLKRGSPCAPGYEPDVQHREGQLGVAEDDVVHPRRDAARHERIGPLDQQADVGRTGGRGLAGDVEGLSTTASASGHARDLVGWRPARRNLNRADRIEPLPRPEPGGSPERPARGQRRWHGCACECRRTWYVASADGPSQGSACEASTASSRMRAASDGLPPRRDAGNASSMTASAVSGRSTASSSRTRPLATASTRAELESPACSKPSRASWASGRSARDSAIPRRSRR